MLYSAAPYIRRAYYYETDKMGIVHHSNYVRWFEEARMDYMKQSGFQYDEMEHSGIIMPVTGVSCKYTVSVRFDEAVKIFTKLEFFNGIRASYSYEIYSCDENLAASGESSHCFLDLTNKTPVNLKKRYPEFYKRGLILLKENQ